MVGNYTDAGGKTNSHEGHEPGTWHLSGKLQWHDSPHREDLAGATGPEGTRVGRGARTGGSTLTLWVRSGACTDTYRPVLDKYCSWVAFRCWLKDVCVSKTQSSKRRLHLQDANATCGGSWLEPLVWWGTAVATLLPLVAAGAGSVLGLGWSTSIGKADGVQSL